MPLIPDARQRLAGGLRSTRSWDSDLLLASSPVERLSGPSGGIRSRFAGRSWTDKKLDSERIIVYRHIGAMHYQV